MTFHTRFFRLRLWWYRQHAPWWFKAGLVSLALLWLVIWCSGCAEFRQAVAAFKQAKEDAETLAIRGADAKLRDSIDWICLHASTRSLAITFTHPDQAEGFKLLCGHPLLLMLPDLVEQMRREREQVETICEPAEVGP